MKFKEWTAVCADNTEDNITAKVWGREIEFSKSVFPTSVKIKGEEILYAPISLGAEFSEIKGEWGQQRVIPIDKTDEVVRYSVTQTAENLIVNADITIEFDGFVKIDLTMMPFWSYHQDKTPRLTKLYLDIPVKKKFATLMHFWPNCESGVCLSNRVLNSHATPDGDTHFAFKPYMWTGWEYGGIGLCCENDKGFEIDNISQCMTVSSNDEYTNIHVAILDHMPKDWQGRDDEWGNTIRPLKYSFAIQPTPVKEFNDKHLSERRSYHIGNIGGDRHNNADLITHEKITGNGDTLVEKLVAKGIKWLILHEDWSMIQNYGMPYDVEDFKEFINSCHKLGIKVMVYFGYEMSSLHKDFYKKSDEYLNKNTRGNYVGGWQRVPMQRDFTVCYNGGYSDIMIERVKYVMDELGVDGIYTDGTYVPWECANEAHGCGYRDEDNNLKYSYPIYAVREHVKKLYQAVHERGGIIDTHQSSCCMMATLAFVDSYYDGENIQPMLRDDISNMKMDSFRTEFMGLNMGIPCDFIAYTGSKFTMEVMSGVTLLHNVFPRSNRLDDIEYMSKIWEIYDDFGTDKAEWCPYWEQQDISVETENTYASYYKTDDALLIIATCYDEDAKEITIKLDKNYTKAKNTTHPDREVKINQNMITFPIEHTKANIIEIRL